MANDLHPTTQPAIWAVIGGVVSSAVTALIKFWPRKRPVTAADKKFDLEERLADRHESAERDRVASDERLAILRLYKDQIDSLKVTITEIMARHKGEIEAQALLFRQQIDMLMAENQSLRSRVGELEKRIEEMTEG